VPVAGLNGGKAFDMSVGYLALGWVCTCLSWILISKFGRRRIYNIGLAVLTIIMFLIGILDCSPDFENRPAIIWAESTLMVGYTPPLCSFHKSVLSLIDPFESRLSGMGCLISQSVPFATPYSARCQQPKSEPRP